MADIPKASDGLSDGENKNQDQTNAPADPGLIGLIMIAHFHNIATDLESLRRRFTPPVSQLGRREFFGDQEIILAAKSLELRAKQLKLDLNNIDERILPALCKDKEGNYFILAKTVTGKEPRAVAISAEAELAGEPAEPQFLVHYLKDFIDAAHGSKRTELLQLSALVQLWDGHAILLTPRRSAITEAFREFNIAWFIPSLVKYRRLFGEVLAASFVIQLFGLITPLFFQVVMDKVLIHKALTTLDVLAIGFVVAAVFEVVLNGLRNYIFSHTTTRVDVELGARLFDHLMNLPLPWFQARQAGQSVARIRELDSLRNFITSTALTLVIDLGFTVIYFIVMWYYSRTLTYIVIGSLFFYVILSVFITPILKNRLDKKFQHGAANQSFLVEAITGVKTIKSLALEPQMRKRWENMLASYVTTSFRAQNLGQIASQVASFIQKLTTCLIIWFGARQVMDNELTVGQLVAFNMIAGRVSGPILKLTQLWQDFQQAGISLKRLGDILNVPRERGTSSGFSPTPALSGSVQFERVRFRYRPDAPVVIDDLSMDIHNGEIIGLVGASGSGKSTVANLIQRFYHIESGRILLGGVDLASAETAWLRRRIGVVLQENCLFSGTVRENIAICDPGQPLERVVEAAKLAGAHDFIVELPEGYDTQVGEQGVGLSGGQRQRLAIARILTGDPKILIFDEATSALDYESEQVIQKNMAAICRGRTVIIIAHRLTAVRSAHRIFVLEKGRLIESGPPKKLLERRGAFFRMVEAQSQFAYTPLNTNKN
jgi:subfamily B ATP-binding cassette protein HlyB/CyaB